MRMPPDPFLGYIVSYNVTTGSAFHDEDVRTHSEAGRKGTLKTKLALVRVTGGSWRSPGRQ